MRLIPPIAVPLGPSDVAASLVRAGVAVAPEFAARLSAECSFVRADLFGSGRQALARYLASCRAPGRDEVIVPAYTCWSVPAAVVRAGLRVRLVDLDPVSLSVDPGAVAAAAGPRTAAVIVAHLFSRSGVTSPVAEAVRRAAPHARIVEDAAQAWPAPRAAGVDAVLLSFGRGKPLALGGGGAVLHDAQALGSPAGSGAGWTAAVKLAAASVLAKPAWFRIPESLPFLGIGETVYDPDFDPEGALFEWQAQLGLRQLGALASHALLRTAHARSLAAAGAGIAGWTAASPAHGDGPIRFPILAPDRAERDRVLRGLRSKGVAASAMYPGTLVDIPALGAHLANAGADFPGASAVAARLLTLPVYPTLTEPDVRSIATAFRQAAERRAA